MNSLRARLVLLLVVAITSVATMAAFVTFKIVDRPTRESFERTFAEEVRLVSLLLDGSADKARAVGIRVGPPPDPRTVNHEHSAGINRELKAIGSDSSALIVEAEEGTTDWLAVPIAEGEFAYLLLPRVPRSLLPPLLAYLTFVVLGSVAVAILATNKIVSPLEMLEQAIASVGPDGELATIDEKGPVEVRATAKALNRLSQRLRGAMESRMRLVAAAGHDLRTPMTRMRLRAEFLPPEDQETWLKDLEELDRIADSAIRLVREEVAADTDEFGVRLDLLLAEIGSELREVGKSVNLSEGPPVSVEARPLALKRALRNLVDNAAMHGGGATIRLIARGPQAIVEIDDDGPGIPEALLERVFEPFFRVDAARRRTQPGAGLGFAIAKEILDQAGGTIAIANRPGGGLRQTVTLRIMTAPA